MADTDASLPLLRRAGRHPGYACAKALVAAGGGLAYRRRTMLARLILALLLATFALPSVAAMPACHEAGDAMAGMTMTDMTMDPAMTMDHRKDAHHPVAAQHVCLGCVLPDRTPPARFDRIALVAAPPPPGTGARGAPLAPVAPATPPPRRSV